MEEKPEIAILGGGAGGLSMAAELTSRGFQVNLYESPKFGEAIKPIQERGGVDATGLLTGFHKLNKVTTDIKEAIEGVDLVFMVSRAVGHEGIFKNCLPYLEKGQVFLNWTSYWSSLRLVRLLEEKGLYRDVILAEGQIFPYMCERSGPSSILMRGIKALLRVAAMPAVDTSKIMGKVKKVYPQCVPADNILDTALNNLNVPVHIGIILSNLGVWEQTNGDFEFFGYGVTPSVGKILDAVDKERLAVGKALNLELVPQWQWNVKMYGHYGSKGKSMYEVLHTLESHRTFRYRIPLKKFIESRSKVWEEDLTYGLVPIASLGDLLNVPTPTIDSLIHLAVTVAGIDYWHEGVTAEKLGLSRLTAKEIIEYVTRG